MNTTIPQALIDELRKKINCLYIECPESIVDNIMETVEAIEDSAQNLTSKADQKEQGVQAGIWINKKALIKYMETVRDAPHSWVRIQPEVFKDWCNELINNLQSFATYNPTDPKPDIKGGDDYRQECEFYYKRAWDLTVANKELKAQIRQQSQSESTSLNEQESLNKSMDI